MLFQLYITDPESWVKDHYFKTILGSPGDRDDEHAEELGWVRVGEIDVDIDSIRTELHGGALVMLDKELGKLQKQMDDIIERKNQLLALEYKPERPEV